MKKVSIIELDKDFDVPESWSELTGRQIRYVFKQYDEWKHHQNYNLFLMRLLDYFFLGKQKNNIPRRRWSPYSVELADIFFSFLISHYEKGCQINYTETTNHLPKLYIAKGVCMDPDGACFYPKKEFIGPETLLADITFEEFEAANMYLKEYTGGDSDSLYRFVACLYFPKTFQEWWKLRKTRKFNEKDVEKNALLIKKHCKAWQLEMILLWYCNCVNHIQTEDIYFNGSIVNFSCLFGKKNENDDEPAEKNNLGWLPILHDFAEKGIFGNLKKTKQANLYDLLVVMLDNYQENQKLKKEYEKIRSKH